MSSTLTLNPVTRIEGHLSIHAETESYMDKDATLSRIKEARCEGEMFRGMERILIGRDPMDAQVILQRICGVCPISHGMASVKAQEMAYKIKPTKNGRLLQNLLLAANYLHSHVLHFYQLAGLDFVDITALLKYEGNDATLKSLKKWAATAIEQKDPFPAAPLLPRFEVPYLNDADKNVALLAHYAEALHIRRICDEMGAIVGAKLPHSTALVPGGCTQVPTIDMVAAYASRLEKVSQFIRDVYWPDMLSVGKAFSDYFDIGKGCGNYLSFGVFDMDDSGNRFLRPGVLINGKWEALDESAIAEEAQYSWFANGESLHPSKGETNPAPNKSGAYSWIKSPRYRGMPLEVGPLARVLTSYYAPGDNWVKKEVDAALASLSLPVEKMQSVMGRHVSRGLESLWLSNQMMKWLGELDLGASPATDFQLPASGSGFGLVEAPRGALGHWITIENYRIKRYQCIVPTTWNCSPRDAKGTAGPVEQALAGLPVRDAKQPIEVGRVVRSFDPCLACAIH